MNRYDAIILGGGHNGLVCAAYLARAGKRVALFERRPVLGGACVTEEVWPGYRVSSAAYLCSLLHPEIASDLGLFRRGFEIYRRDPSGFAPFADGSSLLFHADAARTDEALRRFAPGEIPALRQFATDIELATDIFEPFLLGPSPDLNEVEDSFRARGAAHLFEPLFQGSVRSFLENRFRDPRLMAVLATDGLIGTAGGPSTPGTAYVMLHHYMGRILGSRGAWAHVRGGMGRLSEAIARAASEAGAELRASAAVERVLVRGGRVAGVCLEGGETFSSDAVFSNADAGLATRLLGSEAPESLRAGAEALAPNGVSCKINLGVGELPDFFAARGTEPGPQHTGTVHLSQSMDHLDRAWEEAAKGAPSTDPMVEIYIQTSTDSSLAPPGKHILSCFTQYFPYRLAGGLDFEREKNAYIERVIRTIGAFASNVPASIEHCEALCPQDLEARFGLPGGHIFHGDILPDRMFGGRAGQRGAATELEGFYLCGSSAWPGGCVSGVPGWNAAREFLAKNG